MQRCLGAVAIWAVLAGLALADMPQTSPRPMPRPVAGGGAPPMALQPAVAPAAIALPQLSGFASVRPQPRPAALGAASTPAVVVMASAVTATTPPKTALPGFLRPAKRPDGFARRTLAAAGAIKLAPGKQAWCPERAQSAVIRRSRVRRLPRSPQRSWGAALPIRSRSHRWPGCA